MESSFSIFFILASLFGSNRNYETSPVVPQHVIESFTRDLVSYEHFPTDKEINYIEIETQLYGNFYLTEPSFLNATQQMIRPLSPEDKKIQLWDYTPWAIVNFTTDDGDYRATIFSGGLGFLTFPNGEKGAFMMDYDKRGTIQGMVFSIQDGLKIPYVIIALSEENTDLFATDDDGAFSSGSFAYGTYDLKISAEQSDTYPIMIHDFTIDDAFSDVGMLPIFHDPYGYETEWGERNDEAKTPYFESYPAYVPNNEREKLEQSYIEMFAKYAPERKIHFESIVSKNETGTESNTTRYVIIDQ